MEVHPLGLLARESLYFGVGYFGVCSGGTITKGRGDCRGNSLLEIGLLCGRQRNILLWRGWNFGSVSGQRVSRGTTQSVTSVDWIWRRVVTRKTASASGRHDLHDRVGITCRLRGGVVVSGGVRDSMDGKGH